MTEKKPILAAILGIVIAGMLLASIVFVLPSLFQKPDPLVFSLNNMDINDHEVAVEIFDSNNNSIFKESYLLVPGEYVKSPKITCIIGTYKYEITLDNNITKTQMADVRYATTLSSSDSLIIAIVDDPDDPLDIGVVVS
ncbi:hypothetical protein [Methanococcoides sp. NM1]|uniref:hypothetical protein n=1 Tax=Methanococcoides sp. NM1 TaxID=1201013 RepID=UPI001082E812|nr:hypothetical protein [Methanococcoides sp. NM1]